LALEFLESFDGYGNSEFPLRWVGSGNVSIVPGRNGNGCNVGSGGGLQQTVAYNANWVVGFAANFSYSSIAVGEIYAALTPTATGLIKIVIESDGTVSLYTQGSSSPIGNTGDALKLNTHTWYYFEIKFSISGSTMVETTATLRVNKQTVLGPVSGNTGWDSTQSLTKQCALNQHLFSGSSIPGGTIFDDIYIFNQDGGVNDDFAGDVKILVIKPDQDILTPFQKVGGSGPSYTCINEIPPDYDTSYLYDNTNGDFENFNWQPLPAFFGSVICVQYTIFARKDDEGSRAFQHTMGPGPTSKSSAHYIGDSYLYYMWELDTGPGGAMWTVALFNATSFGFIIFPIPIPS
jgi:hypothetical protein